MNDLLFTSAAGMAAMVRRREVSPVELVQAHINRIEEINPAINAYVTTLFEAALDTARTQEKDLASGKETGPLFGVPISIKDTIETAGVRTVGGTRLREQYVPEADAPVVERLRRAGAIVLGKTNVPECAMDYRSENPVFGRTKNPWDLARTPGGSSGGEGAAISSGCSAGGIGSDLGGSIRVPSHFCGIAGLKPTPGRVPGAGHFPPSLGPFSLGASLGPMARRVEDLKLMLGVVEGFDPRDPASAPVSRRTERDKNNLRGLGVMWYAEDGVAPVTRATREAVRNAARALTDAGLEVIERRPQKLERAHELWFVWLGQGGTPGIVAMYDGKEDLMGPLVRELKRGALTNEPTLGQFLKAWFRRDGLRSSLLGEMQDHPIILAPVASVPAFRHEHEGDFDVEGQTVSYVKAFSYSQAFNLVGFPSAVVPCGRSPEGLPIGVQVVGRPFEEQTVLAVAEVLEQALGGYQRPPI